jgi:hypothetical protein
MKPSAPTSGSDSIIYASLRRISGFRCDPQVDAGAFSGHTLDPKRGAHGISALVLRKVLERRWRTRIMLGSAVNTVT